MSAQALFTVVLPFHGKWEDVNRALDAVGNPVRDDVRTAIGETGVVHFMSMTVVPGEKGGASHLILEASVDGGAKEAIDAIVRAVRADLEKIFAAAGIETWDTAELLKHSLCPVGSGWFKTPGVVYSGTPAMTVGRILLERDVAAEIERWVEANPGPRSPRATLEAARSAVFAHPRLKRGLVAEPMPFTDEAGSIGKAVFAIAWSVVCEFLWPLAIPALAVAAIAYALDRTFDVVVWDFVLTLGLEILAGGMFVLLTYRRFRSEEDAELPGDDNPEASRVADVMARENRCAQNHLFGISTMKPGWVRETALRLALWFVGIGARFLAKPGFLSDIGTIHFARWILVPGTNKLLFYSNYGGSWTSYLEDFIARAHAGLSAVWSNTTGFPPTRNLIDGGAEDGERFKRWARCQQHPTRFWYSAYPDLTTERIRINAAIRYGLATASDEASVRRWLECFHFPRANRYAVETDEIPTLVFGGLSGLNHGHFLAVQLAAGDPGAAKRWLALVEKDIAYGERKPVRSALVCALAPRALEHLGIGAALPAFPTAFQHGMTADWRARALGDSHAQPWKWGAGPGYDTDLVLLIYADTDANLNDDVAQRTRELESVGHVVRSSIRLTPVPPKGQPIREPFGFVDGISQPLIRGTRRWVLERNEIHMVEPGEFVLGYPDNLGYVSPTPFVNGRDVGRNGTFLVVRQLEQHVREFDDWAKNEAPRLNVPVDLLKAKVVGRWQDGSSLVRHPYQAATPNAAGEAGDNDFLFGAEDPQGMRCPFGAHIRRANPRESLAPGSKEQIGITNRHRIFRVGRRYDAKPNGTDNPGLLFMCVNGDIEGQFEFLQQTWVLGSSFHGLQNETDPLFGGASAGLTIPGPQGPRCVRNLSNFVTVRGGGYFFMPGRSTMRFLAN